MKSIQFYLGDASKEVKQTLRLLFSRYLATVSCDWREQVIALINLLPTKEEREKAMFEIISARRLDILESLENLPRGCEEYKNRIRQELGLLLEFGLREEGNENTTGHF